MISAHKRTGFNRWKRGLFASIAGSIVVSKKVKDHRSVVAYRQKKWIGVGYAKST